MAKLTVSGQPCLNASKGKASYIVVKSDTDDTFDATSKVSKVVDGINKLQWSGEKHWINQKGNRLKARLKTDKGREPAKDRDTLDAGTVTVTVTVAGTDTSIPNVPVDYITDPT